MNGYDNEAVLNIRDGRLSILNLNLICLLNPQLLIFNWYSVAEFLIKEDCNFIAVDWEELANNLNYYSSASNTQPVGTLTGDFINFLIAQGSNVSEFHVIGFSLGAHVAGRAGAVLNGCIPRITGN